MFNYRDGVTEEKQGMRSIALKEATSGWYHADIDSSVKRDWVMEAAFDWNQLRVRSYTPNLQSSKRWNKIEWSV